MRVVPYERELMGGTARDGCCAYNSMYVAGMEWQQQQAGLALQCFFHVLGGLISALGSSCSTCLK
jgi:hypothetical protein